MLMNLQKLRTKSMTILIMGVWCNKEGIECQELLSVYTLQWEDDIIGLEGLMEDMDDFEMDTVPPPPPPLNFTTPSTSRQPKPVPSSSMSLPMKTASSVVLQSAVNSTSSLGVASQSMKSSSLSGSKPVFKSKFT